MKNRLTCPFCQQELGIILCDTDDLVCSKCRMCGTEKLWTALIQAKQDLEIAVDTLKSAKTRFERINNSKFANLNNVLQIQSQCEILNIDKALEQIEHKQ